MRGEVGGSGNRQEQLLRLLDDCYRLEASIKMQLWEEFRRHAPLAPQAPSTDPQGLRRRLRSRTEGPWS